MAPTQSVANSVYFGHCATVPVPCSHDQRGHLQLLPIWSARTAVPCPSSSPPCSSSFPSSTSPSWSAGLRSSRGSRSWCVADSGAVEICPRVMSMEGAVARREPLGPSAGNLGSARQAFTGSSKFHILREGSRTLANSRSCRRDLPVAASLAARESGVLTPEDQLSSSGSDDERSRVVMPPRALHLVPLDQLEQTPIFEQAWKLLRESVVTYCGQPVGTLAACDPTDLTPLNYDQVFIRDFVPSAIAFLLAGEFDVVRNFLLHTLQLQSWEKTVDCYTPGEGLMPASFKVRHVQMEDGDPGDFEEILDPDFGESAIGRVAPVDSGLWWITLLRAYGRCTGDLSLQERVDVQTGIKLILKVCLADHFDMFPTLITTDGPCMIDRRLGIHGHPLEIQALFYGALRAAREMVTPEAGGVEVIRAINARLTALSFHIREYYWVDLPKLNEIYRYKTEEYSHEAVNKFNIYPEQVSPWLLEWMPAQGGYFVGNVQPAHMDFRFFSLGNLWAVVVALASQQQAQRILDLIEAKWDDLIGGMPLKICWPALVGHEWTIITGADPKNTPWSYHNGGSWPVLLWQFTAACIKMGRPELAQRAIELAEARLMKDRWPEYYDTKGGRFIGKQARLHQTWSIAGYLAAKMMLANPKAVAMLDADEDWDLLEATTSFLRNNPRKRRRSSAASTPPF